MNISELHFIVPSIILIFTINIHIFEKLIGIFRFQLWRYSIISYGLFLRLIWENDMFPPNGRKEQLTDNQLSYIQSFINKTKNSFIKAISEW